MRHKKSTLLIICLVLLLSFSTALSVYAASVTPEYIDGNDPSSNIKLPTGCSKLKTLKIENENKELNSSDIYEKGSFHVTVTPQDFKDDDEVTSIDWESNKKVYYVFVKAGNGGYLYDYVDLHGLYKDTDLETPENKEVSHIIFYYCDPDPIDVNLSKIVTNDVDEDGSTSFTITIDGNNLTNPVVKNISTSAGASFQLHPGTYTIEESELNDYELQSISVDGTNITPDDGVYSFKVKNNDTAIDIVVTNEKEEQDDPDPTGSLQVTKVVDLNGADITVPDFEITITGPSYQNGDTKIFNDTNGFTQIWTDLEPGTYTISEEDPGDDWTVTFSQNTVEVTADNTAEATVTNSYEEDDDPDPTGSLQVTKIVDLNGADITVPDFEITITGPSYQNGDTKTFNDTNGFTQIWTDLEPGTYTISEEDPGDDWNVTISQDTVEVTADNTAEATVTNSYEEEDDPTGTLTIEKIVYGYDGNEYYETNDDTEFTFEIHGSEVLVEGNIKIKGGEQSSRILPFGDYTVKEVNIPSGYTCDDNEQNATVSVESDATVTFYNTYEQEDDTVSLIVNKIVKLNGEEITDSTPFNVTISPKLMPTMAVSNGNTKTISAQTNGSAVFNLEPGRYSITETPQDGYDIEGMASGDVDLDETGDRYTYEFEIDGTEEDDVVITITNIKEKQDDDTVNLIVNKIVKLNSEEVTDPTPFNVTINKLQLPEVRTLAALTSGITKTISAQTNGSAVFNLEPGYYSIIETPKTGYEIEGMDSGDVYLSENDDEYTYYFVISGEETSPVKITITNIKEKQTPPPGPPIIPPRPPVTPPTPPEPPVVEEEEEEVVVEQEPAETGEEEQPEVEESVETEPELPRTSAADILLLGLGFATLTGGLVIRRKRK